MLELKLSDFEAAFGAQFNNFVSEKIKSFQFKFTNLKEDETKACWFRAQSVLNSDSIVRAGEHRLPDWEKGWAENADSVKDNFQEDSLLPKYFHKIDIVRWRQQWIRPLSEKFEYQMFAALQYWIFDRYLRDKNSIYEFGCGTGHNLLRVREVNSEAKLFGLDWAKSSQDIFLMLKEKGLQNIFGHSFNFFKPDYHFNLDKNSAVLTIASLEQTGNYFEPFIDYLIEKKPSLVIHIEPIQELLDYSNPLDKLSIDYFRRRNYLNGLLPFLKKKEAENKIEIVEASRNWIGSFFIEGYSVVVWRPNN